MATPDITGLIVKQTNNQLAKTKPVTNSLLPEVPSATITNDLPPEVLQALDSGQEINRTVLQKERLRLDSAMNYSKAANGEIADAQKQLDEIEANPFLEFQGLFDEEYNKEAQQAKIEATKKRLQIKNQELDYERQKDALTIKENSLPLQEFKQKNALQKDAMSLSVAQNTAIIQSNAAKAATLKMLQTQVTPEEIDRAEKYGDYTEVVTPDFVQTYKQDLQKFNLDMQTKQLALDTNRFDLARKIETNALEKAPRQWLQWLVADADKNNKATLAIPGTSTPISVDNVRAMLAKKTAAEDKSFATIAAQQRKLVQNNAAMSSALAGVSSVSSVYTSGSPEVQSLANLGSLNLLNITDKTATELPLDRIVPALRTPLYNLLQTQANLNLKQTNGQPLQPQELANRDNLIKELQTKSDEIKKQQYEAASKMAKPAIKEWNTFGAIHDQQNAAGLVVANSVTIPNLGNDAGLNALAQVYQENVASVLLEGEVDLSKIEDPTERQAAIFKALATSGYQAKVTSRAEAIKAMHKKNSKGISPVDAYTQTKIGVLMSEGMQELGTKYPEFSNYFKALDRETGFKNPLKLAQSLAALSFKRQQADESLPDLNLGQELMDIMNLKLKSSREAWDSQTTPVRAAFMRLAFNGSPTSLVDTNLSLVFGTPLRQTWDKIVKENQMQITSASAGGLFSTKTPEQIRAEAIKSFSPVPLPEIK
ncbi:MAG TPA: hypothetical protein ENJ28_04845 [Gammaproteobacteria bacterium]|nr:hypothetical protein [Gammaproteobacteria bacterium]